MKGVPSSGRFAATFSRGGNSRSARWRQLLLPACGEKVDGAKRQTDERLSCWSSVLRLPWSFVAQDGVEDGEEFAGDSDEGDELWLSAGDELVAEAS